MQWANFATICITTGSPTPIAPRSYPAMPHVGTSKSKKSNWQTHCSKPVRVQGRALRAKRSTLYPQHTGDTTMTTRRTRAQIAADITKEFGVDCVWDSLIRAYRIENTHV